MIESIVYNHKRISQVIFFKGRKSLVESKFGVRFIYLENTLSPNDCGQICKGTFSINIPHFTEAKQFNSCLNRKISLDKTGNIKNCPSQEVNYGHINKITLQSVVMDQYFQEKWKIKKDDIEICKDCEHRYICTDCRVFIQDKNNPFSKPSKCNYDPYTATWV